MNTWPDHRIQTLLNIEFPILLAPMAGPGSGDFMALWAGQAAHLGRALPAGELTRLLAKETWQNFKRDHYLETFMNPTFFSDPADFRDWLAENHDKETELLVGYYKVGTGKPSMTWSQSVDEALCFGWIDGVRRSVDAHSYCIRFTPRKAKSIWSAVNIQKIGELTRQGLMHPMGLAAFEKREEHKSKIYAYEQADVMLSEEFELVFKASQNAWTSFQAMAPSYKKMAINWVMSAKQKETASKRLLELIGDSALGLKVKSFRR